MIQDVPMPPMYLRKLLPVGQNWIVFTPRDLAFVSSPIRVTSLVGVRRNMSAMGFAAWVSRQLKPIRGREWRRWLHGLSFNGARQRVGQRIGTRGQLICRQ